MVWACLGAIVCAYTQFSWTLWQLWQNTDTLKEWKRQRFTVLIVGFFFVCLFLMFLSFPFCDMDWNMEWKKCLKKKKTKTKKVVALDNTIMSNIQFEFCNICMYVWKFCELVMVCTFWHMSVCISSNFKNACFLFFGFVLHVDCRFFSFFLF